MLLGCFEGAPPQSKVDLPEFSATKVSKLCFSAASVNSKNSHSTKVLLLCCSAPPQSTRGSQNSRRLRCRVFASRLLRKSSSVVSLLLSCFGGAPPQSKGWASLNTHSTQVLLLCFVVASKELAQSAASVPLGCFEGAPPQSKVDLPRFSATKVSKLCFSAASKELKCSVLASQLLRSNSQNPNSTKMLLLSFATASKELHHNRRVGHL